jgi:hypothetical protein
MAAGGRAAVGDQFYRLFPVFTAYKGHGHWSSKIATSHENERRAEKYQVGLFGSCVI